MIKFDLCQLNNAWKSAGNKFQLKNNKKQKVEKTRKNILDTEINEMKYIRNKF